MGQVTIYLEDEIEKKMNAAMKSAQVSKSKWVAQLIREKVADDWPQSIVDMAGTWNGFPAIDDIRETQTADAARDKFSTPTF